MMTFDVDRLSPRLRRLVLRTATLLGIALLVAAGLEAGKSLKLLQGGQSLPGEVVDLGAKRPFVRFTRPDGQVSTFRADALTMARPGQHVTVLFDPIRPDLVPTVATPLALWLKPVLLAVPGMLLFGFGFRRRGRTAG